MKSYLRFLSRNKLYATIEVVGLSIALAFVVVLSSYIVNDMSINSMFRNTANIYLHHPDNNLLQLNSSQHFHENIAEIEAVCNYTTSGPRKSILDEIATLSHQDNECAVGATGVDSNFFDFFTIPLKEGNPSTALEMRNSVLISEEVANILFPDGDAMGKTVRLFEENPIKKFVPEITADLDIVLTVTGIFTPYENTVFYQNEMIMRYDLMSETISELTDGMLVYPSMFFVRLSDNNDLDIVTAKINDNFQNSPESIRSSMLNVKEFVLTPFDALRECNFENMEYLTNLRPVKLFNIYMIMCIFIVIVSLLDYIVLTIAFSRFRIKEIATRQLLGTERAGVMVRCFSEALLLILVSCFFALLLALGFKEPIGQILGTKIDPLSHLGEYIILSGIILLMVVIASAVPSYILSSYKPINVIKGEVRYRDRKYIGKIFIGFAGFLSVASLSVCIGILRQVKHLLNQPLGYETEDIVYVEFQGDEINRYFDELKTLPFVTKSGTYEDLPYLAQTYIIWDAQDRPHQLQMSSGNRECFDLLGIDILEDYDPSPNYVEGKIYVCENSKEVIPYLMEDIEFHNYYGYKYGGIAADYKVGSLNYDNTGKLTAIAVVDSPGNKPLMKVNIDEDEAILKIEEFYRSKGYDDAFFKVKSLNRLHKEETREERNMLTLVLGFSLICILMTSMCVLGLSSYYGKTTEKNNAIRNVFGCSKMTMIRKVALDFVVPVIIAATVAIPITYIAIGRWLENYLISIDNSLSIYITALAIVMVVVITSTISQGVRLMRTNPAEALKKE